MQISLENLFDNLKNKIGELKESTRSKDSIRFANLAQEICRLIAELGRQIGVQNFTFPKAIFQQFSIDFHLPEPAKKDVAVSKLFLKIEDLHLSNRATHCLKRKEMNYVGDLVQKKEIELLKIRNFGRKCLREVKQELEPMGLRLGMQIPGWVPNNIKKPLSLVQAQIQKGYQFNAEESTGLRQQPEPINLPPEKFTKLLRKVEDLELSVRAGNCLKDLGISYIGDLVHKSPATLLKTPNFGRKSLAEIKWKLGLMSLSLGMDILGWPPQNIKDASRRYAPLVKKIEMKEARVLRKASEEAIDNLEDELYQLSMLAGNERYAQMVCKLLGWDGKGKRTLQAVANDFNVTRERVRQVSKKFRKRVSHPRRRKIIYYPILASALESVVRSLPAAADTIESKLANEGISKGIFRLEGLLTAVELLDKKPAFTILRLYGKRFAVGYAESDVPKSILQHARRSVSKFGIATVRDIADQVAQKSNRPIDTNFAFTVLSSAKDFHLLDDSGGWFWLSSLPRNRLLNVMHKILSVSGQIEIGELRAGVGRFHRMAGFAPPRRVLLALCRLIPRYRIEGNIVTADPQIDWEEVLTGSTEWALAGILKEQGPVMNRKKLEEICLDELGMNRNTFYVYLTYSPILTKYAVGVYGLRGARVTPGVIESLRPKETQRRVLLDFGWTSDGMIWMGFETSRAMIDTGVFTIPAAMRKFVQGEFKLKAGDGANIGDLRVEERRGWGLRQFFHRRGGEAGDYVALTFDMHSRESRIYIGDEGLLDIFRAQDESSLFDNGKEMPPLS